MLAKMGNKLEALEDEIFEGRSAEIVRDISNVKQEIINFRKIVRPQRAALRDLERTKRYIPEGLDIYFDDINDASERIWDMLENFKEVVEGLESTNESVLSHRVNDVLRVAHGDQRRRPAAHAGGEHLRDERRGARARATIEGFWVVSGLHVPDARRHARLLPQPRLVVAAAPLRARAGGPPGCRAPAQRPPRRPRRRSRRRP